MGSYSRKRYATESASFPKSASSAPGSYSYENFADLPASGSTPGNTAFVVATNKLYIWSGVGWYLIATVTNVSPTAISGVDGAYTLAIDGTATTITAVSTDPEGFALTWSYVVSSGSLGSTATVSQADNVFTITPSTNSAHEGTFSLTFSVTDGINGVVSAVSSFTLQFSVANSRYTRLSVKATNTGSNQTFDDGSTSNYTITANGDVATSAFSPYRHGGYALHGDGTGDYLQIPHSTDTNLTGDFTIECWVYLNSGKEQGFVSKWTVGSYGWTLYTTTTSVTFLSGTGGSPGSATQLTTSALALKQWHHLAVSRTGSTISTYLNGTRTNTSTDSNNCSTSTPVVIGSVGQNFSADSINGYMRDVRIVNGTGLYTGTSFAVPTEPLTAITNTKFLLGDLPYFKDQSASNHTITSAGNVSLKPFSLFDNAPYSEASHGASVKIESSGSNRLTSPITAMGTGDFTVSGWVYTIGSNNPDIIFDTRPIASDASTGFYFAQYNAGYFYVGTAGNNFGPIQGTTNYPKNAWNHFAIVRDSSGNLKMYINGNLEGTDAIGTSKDLTSTDITIGSNRAGSSTCNAYVSDLRIVHSVLYTTTFTPPTAPLTAVTNTKFLLNPETSISDLSQSSTITCFGNTATSTTQVKFAGTKSIYFDGTGDYISAENDAGFSFGTGDFTVESWLYHTNNSASYYDLIGTAKNSGYMGSNRGGWIFAYYHTHGSTFALRFGYQYNNAFPVDITFSKTLNVNTWYHIAITRQGNQLKCFADGIQVGSTTTNSTNLISTEPLNIGTGSGISTYVTGYMQDVRVTKGLARYTANFTPPTELQG